MCCFSIDSFIHLFYKSQDNRHLGFSNEAFCPIERHIAFDFNNRLVDALNLSYCYELERNFDISDWYFDRRNILLREESVF